MHNNRGQQFELQGINKVHGAAGNMVFRGTVVCGGVPWGVEGYHGGNMECTEVMNKVHGV